MSEQTRYHLRSAQGWVNDPNGPLLYRGVYHMFYQHVPNSAHWAWGLVWGHATSTDLITWCHHTPALVPTPGHYDEDGCFSGCATVDDDGRPVLLYTGVRRKPCADWLRPSSLTVSEMCEEVQLMAVARDPEDACLIHWDKVMQPLLASPGVPAEVSLNCWRDPFILERPTRQQAHMPTQQQQRQQQCRTAEQQMQLQGGRRGVEDEVVTSTGIASSGSGNSSMEAGVAGVRGGWRIMVGSGVRQSPVVLPSDTASRRRALGTAWVYTSPRLAPVHHGQVTLQQADLSTAGMCQESRTAGMPSCLTMPPGSFLKCMPGNTRAFVLPHGVLGTWQLEGPLCTAATPNRDGPVWECPLLVRLPCEAPPDIPNIDLLAQQATAEQSCTPYPSPATTQPDTADPPGKHSNAQHSHTWLFSASVGTCPAQYWLGQYSSGQFDLVNSTGPLALDGGDTLYAPNVLQDAQGRVLLWGWLMELPHRPVGPGWAHAGPCAPAATTSRQPSAATAGADSSSTHAAASAKVSQSGCISLPRVLTWRPAAATSTASRSSSSSRHGRLHQAPLPELLQLQEGPQFTARGLELLPGAARWLGRQVSNAHCLLSCTFRPCPSHSSHDSTGRQASEDAVAAGAAGLGGSCLPGPAAGLLLPAGPGGDAVLLLYDSAAATLQLQVGAGVGDEWIGMIRLPSGAAPVVVDAGAGSRDPHTGGKGTGSRQPAALRTLLLQLEGAAYRPLEVVVFVDGSVVEVFADGQVLSTRAYRGLNSAAVGEPEGCFPGAGVVLWADAPAQQQHVASAVAHQAGVKADVSISTMRSMWK